MRTPVIIIFALILAGCASSPKSPPLTAAQAQALAVRLANDKADALFHHRPFQASRPAQFAAGHWVWTERCGVGLADYQASVELATDGSTNSVDVQLLDNIMGPIMFKTTPAIP